MPGHTKTDKMPQQGLSMGLDNNTISIGTFSGQADFDKASSNLMMAAQNNRGQSDMFIVKTTAHGEVIWAKSLKVNTATVPIIELDSQNNIYILPPRSFTT
jgi:hypothetical protein